MALQVGPEHAAQEAGQRPQAVVVQGRRPLAEVVHEQVADRAAGEPVAVDELAGGGGAVGAQLGQRGRGLLAEHSDPAQHPVEHPGPVCLPRVDLRLDVEQLQHVAHGDLGHRAALGGEDHGGPVQHVARRGRGDARLGRAVRRQPGEPVRVAGRREQRHERAATATGGGHQPGQRGTQHIGTDQERDGQAERAGPVRGARPARGEPAVGHGPPAGAERIGAAGLPALLPGGAGLIGEPVQGQAHPPGAPVLTARRGQGERRRGQPRRQRRRRLVRARPVRCRRPGRKAHPGRPPAPRRPVRRGGLGGRRGRCRADGGGQGGGGHDGGGHDGGGHDGPGPNNAVRLSGR